MKEGDIVQLKGTPEITARVESVRNDGGVVDVKILTHEKMPLYVGRVVAQDATKWELVGGGKVSEEEQLYNLIMWLSTNGLTLVKEVVRVVKIPVPMPSFMAGGGSGSTPTPSEKGEERAGGMGSPSPRSGGSMPASSERMAKMEKALSEALDAGYKSGKLGTEKKNGGGGAFVDEKKAIDEKMGGGAFKWKKRIKSFVLKID